MADAKLSQALAGLSISTVSHDPATNPAQWKELVSASADAPKDFELIKTLVYKPKTAKTATPVPVVVVAREATETNSGAIGKQLNLKELRLATEDLLKEFFGLDKDSRACSVLHFFIAF
jgi:prolyl-tRNA synthetase